MPLSVHERGRLHARSGRPLFVLLGRAIKVAEAAAAIPYHLTDADGKVL